MTIQYHHPRLYDFLISLIYSKKLMGLFSKAVGINHTVFEVAAGYGRMSRFIDPSNTYYGIDLNEIFVNYGKKLGVNLQIKDALNPKNYNTADIFIIVDFVHHLQKDKLTKLFNIIFSHTTKKVIIIEPSFIDFTRRYGVFGKFAGWILQTLDGDGVNKISLRAFPHSLLREIF